MVTMSKGEKTRERIIQEAAFLFLNQGYNATSINDILESTNIAKGSFYFHFKTKQELVQAIADYYGDQKKQEFLTFAAAANWGQFVERLVAHELEKAKVSQNYGCPNGLLGSELSYSLPEVANMFNQNMKEQILILQQVIEGSGVSKEEAIVLAERAFAIYEGRLLLFRISHEATDLIKLKEDLIQLF